MKRKKDHEPEEEIGYAKPPKQYQFKKGHSGNPQGRPKKKKTNAELINELLNHKILVNGKAIPKREAVFLSIVNDAIKGKASARNLLLTLIQDEEAELDEFEETMDDRIAYIEVQRLVSKREKGAS